jgi:basic membrane protein A and related proteins
MDTKRITAGLAAALLGAALLGCGDDASSGSAAQEGGSDVGVALVVNGNLGDGNFFDGAHAGVKDAAEELGITPQVIETGPDPTKWGPALEDAASGEADVIIAGSFAMKELVEQAAAAHPDKQFVLFDVAADPEGCGGCTNIYSVVYRYRETGFLAGALAALHVAEQGDGASIGFVGGQDIPVIQDYKQGWESGAQVAAPEVERHAAFAGSFSDPVKGKKISEAMVEKGAAILFAAAGGTNAGIFEAASRGDAFAIGDSVDEAEHAEVGGRPTVLTSVATDVEGSLAEAVKLAGEGKLPVGEVRSYGVKEGAIHVVDTPTYRKEVPDAVRKRVDAIAKDVAAGAYEQELAG